MSIWSKTRLPIGGGMTAEAKMVSVSVAKRACARVLDTAIAQPVVISHHGKAAAVLMSLGEYLAMVEATHVRPEAGIASS